MATANKAQTSGSLSRWVQEALFTRAADSYFNPLIQGIAPSLVFSRRYRQARVVKVMRHHEHAATLTVVPPRGWSGFVPGQYVCCEFEINGIRRKRNYSICSSEHKFESTGQIQLTVHRVEGGVVSNYVLDEMRLDTSFVMSDAMGEFGRELDEIDRPRKPVLFLAAGSGITPFASFISSGQVQDRKALLLYSCGTSKEHLFKSSLETLTARSSHFFLHLHSTRENSNDQRMDASLIEKLCEQQGIDVRASEVFICGGQSFTEGMTEALTKLGVETQAIHFESFDSRLTFASDSEQHIYFSVSDKRVSSKDANSLLEQAEAAGLSPQSGCRMGICHSCTCKKQSGVVRNLLTGDLSSADEEEIRICVSQAVGEVDIEL